MKRYVFGYQKRKEAKEKRKMSCPIVLYYNIGRDGDRAILIDN